MGKTYGLETTKILGTKPLNTADGERSSELPELKINSEFERSHLVARAIVDCIYNCLISTENVEQHKDNVRYQLGKALEECRGV